MTKTTKLFALVSVCVAVVAWTAAAAAAEWGSLKGRFVIDGPAPTLPELNIGTDAVCTEHHPVNQAVVVGENGGLANVVVYINVPRGKSLEVHPDYAAAKDEPVVLDNNGCSFRPHVCLVRTGQTFIIKNSDPTGHNTNAKLQRNGAFNVLIAQGEEKPMTFNRAESRPLAVNCNIHPFMLGFMLVRDDPYMAASAEDGTLEIADILAGKHEFQFWQEVPGFLKNVALSSGKLDRRGRIELTIPAGGTLDLGEIKIPAAMLQP